MAALDFPVPAAVGERYIPGPGQPVYTWDGAKWTTRGGAIGSTGGSDAVPLPDTLLGESGSSTEWSRGDHAHPTDPAIAAGLALKVDRAGDTMTGHLFLPPTPTDDAHAIRKDYVDGSVASGTSGKVSKSGDTMTGHLTLPTGPAAANAVRKDYVDTAVNNKVSKSGDTMSGNLTAPIYYTTNGTFVSTWGAVELAVTPPGFCYIRPQGYGVTTNQAWFGPDGGLLIGGASALKPGGGSWSDSSDARIKTVLGEYTSGLDQVAALVPKRYSFKANYSKETSAGGGKSVKADPHSSVTGKEFIGVIAQEAETAMPEMVTLTDGYIDGVAVNDIRVLDNSALVYALVNAVKQLKARVEQLEAAP